MPCSRHGLCCAAGTRLAHLPPVHGYKALCRGASYHHGLGHCNLRSIAVLKLRCSPTSHPLPPSL